jgi:GH35 family endo-1,4-beta-xylanase
MRGNLLCSGAVAMALVLRLGANAWAQTTTVNGSAMALQSFANSTSATNYGNDSGTDAILNTDGYVGTYVDMATAGTATLTVNATGTTSDSTLPELGVSVNDTLDKYSVTSGSNNYTATVSLPQGISFVRLQYDNDTDSDPINGNNHSLTINSLQVTGATVENQTDQATLNSNALASANTYINNYRQGSGSVTTGLGSGTQVTVSMVRNAFNFGTNVTGASAGAIDTFLGHSGNATQMAQQANFQAYLNKHFNMLVTSNMGKWSENEATQNVVTMGDMDEMLSYAKEHNMTARAHNLIWGTQQPNFINTDLTNALSTNPTTKANAITALNTAINNRIGYFVGGGDSASTNSTSPGNQLTAMSTFSTATVPNTNDIRSRDYSEIDVLNEPLNNNAYIKAIGISGIASVYKNVQTAVNNAHATVSLNTNEYNVIQNSVLYYNTAGNAYTPTGTDSYANWYSQYINSVNSAGQGKVITGAGIEWYPTMTMPNASTYQQVLQNLAVQGVSIAIPEGGVQSTITAQSAAEVQGVDDIMRMMYGNPNATTFMLWSTWAGATSTMNSSSVMVNTNWSLTATGTRYEYLFGQGTDPTATAATDEGIGGVNQDPWNTPDQTVSADSNGKINFFGAYGEYALKVGGVTYGTVDFEKGANDTPEETLWVKGDFDLNGKLDNGDLQALLSALTNQNSSNGLDGYQASHNMSNEEFLAICDINGDGLVNAKDIAGLEQLLASGVQVGNGVFGGGSVSSVPEPTSAVLAVISFGFLMFGVRRGRRAKR